MLPVLALAAALAAAAPDAGAQSLDPREDPFEAAAATDAEAAAAVRQAVPFTAEQIERILTLLDDAQRTAAEAIPPPEPRLRELRLALDPAAPPPVVATRRGYATALVFLDATGAPWPVAEALIDETFAVDDGGGTDSAHIVFLAPSQDHRHGNAIIVLEGLDAPVTLALSSGGAVADFRVDLRLPLPGPSADPAALLHPVQIQPREPLAGFFLAGAPPPDAVALELAPAHAGERAWALAGRVWLRSRSPLLSPAAEAVERSAAGDYLYALPDTPYALLADGPDGARRVAFRHPETPDTEAPE